MPLSPAEKMRNHRARTRFGETVFGKAERAVTLVQLPAYLRSHPAAPTPPARRSTLLAASADHAAAMVEMHGATAELEAARARDLGTPEAAPAAGSDGKLTRAQIWRGWGDGTTGLSLQSAERLSEAAADKLAKAHSVLQSVASAAAPEIAAYYAQVRKHGAALYAEALPVITGGLARVHVISTRLSRMSKIVTREGYAVGGVLIYPETSGIIHAAPLTARDLHKLYRVLGVTIPTEPHPDAWTVPALPPCPEPVAALALDITAARVDAARLDAEAKALSAQYAGGHGDGHAPRVNGAYEAATAAGHAVERLPESYHRLAEPWRADLGQALRRAVIDMRADLGDARAVLALIDDALKAVENIVRPAGGVGTIPALSLNRNREPGDLIRSLRSLLSERN